MSVATITAERLCANRMGFPFASTSSAGGDAAAFTIIRTSYTRNSRAILLALVGAIRSWLLFSTQRIYHFYGREIQAFSLKAGINNRMATDTVRDRRLGRVESSVLVFLCHQHRQVREIANALLVGSRTGAVIRRTPLVCIQGFPCRARVGSSVIPFPIPATSHAACGFPALRAPVRFVSRFMGVPTKYSVALAPVAITVAGA